MISAIPMEPWSIHLSFYYNPCIYHFVYMLLAKQGNNENRNILTIYNFRNGESEIFSQEQGHHIRIYTFNN